jgi:hypothetical protein
LSQFTFEAYAAQDLTEVWNVYIPDKVPNPSIQRQMSAATAKYSWPGLAAAQAFVELPRRRRYTERALGRSQVVRHRILIPAFPGSNPGAPASM